VFSDAFMYETSVSCRVISLHYYLDHLGTVVERFRVPMDECTVASSPMERSMVVELICTVCCRHMMEST
jgi:hypothetical protein